MKFNKPQMKNSAGEILIPMYKHQKLAIDYNGFHIQIEENGKVKLVSPGVQSAENPAEVEFDEITVPASVIFKVATLLSDTREITYVTKAEMETAQAKQLQPAV